MTTILSSCFSRSSGYSATEFFGNFSEFLAQNLKCDLAFDAIIDDALITLNLTDHFCSFTIFTAKTLQIECCFFQKDVIFFKV